MNWENTDSNILEVIATSLPKILPYDSNNYNSLEQLFLHPLDYVTTSYYNKIIDRSSFTDSIQQFTCNLLYTRYLSDEKLIPLSIRIGNGFIYQPVLSNLSNKYKSNEDFNLLPDNTKMLLNIRTKFPEAYARLVGGYNIKYSAQLSKAVNSYLGSEYEDPIVIDGREIKMDVKDLFEKIYNTNYINSDLSLFDEDIFQLLQYNNFNDEVKTKIKNYKKNFSFGTNSFKFTNVVSKEWITVLVLYYVFQVSLSDNIHYENTILSYILSTILRPLKIAFPNFLTKIQFNTRLYLPPGCLSINTLITNNMSDDDFPYSNYSDNGEVNLIDFSNEDHQYVPVVQVPTNIYKGDIKYNELNSNFRGIVVNLISDGIKIKFDKEYDVSFPIIENIEDNNIIINYRRIYFTNKLNELFVSYVKILKYVINRLSSEISTNHEINVNRLHQVYRIFKDFAIKTLEYFDMNVDPSLKVIQSDDVYGDLVNFIKTMNITGGYDKDIELLYPTKYNFQIPSNVINDMNKNKSTLLFINPMFVKNFDFINLVSMVNYIYYNFKQLYDTKNVTNEQNDNNKLEDLNIYQLFWDGIPYSTYENLSYNDKIVLSNTCYLLGLYDMESNNNEKTTFALSMKDAMLYGINIKSVCIIPIPIDNNKTLYKLYKEVYSSLSEQVSKKLNIIRTKKVRSLSDIDNTKILNIGLNSIGTEKFVKSLPYVKTPINVVALYYYYLRDYKLNDNETYHIFPYNSIEYSNLVSALLRAFDYYVEDITNNVTKEKIIKVTPRFDIFSLKKKIFAYNNNFTEEKKNQIMNFINIITKFINQFTDTKIKAGSVDNNETVYTFKMEDYPTTKICGINIDSLDVIDDVEEHLEVDLFKSENEHFIDGIFRLYENKKLTVDNIINILPDNVIKRFEINNITKKLNNYFNKSEDIGGSIDCGDTTNPFDELREALEVVGDKLKEEKEDYNNCLELAKELLNSEKLKITETDINKLNNDLGKLIYNDKVAKRDAITCLASVLSTELSYLKQKGIIVNDAIKEDLISKIKEKFIVDTEFHNLCLILQIAKDITNVLYKKKIIKNGCTYEISSDHLNMFYNIVKEKLQERRNMDQISINKFLKDLTSALYDSKKEEESINIKEITNNQFL